VNLPCAEFQELVVHLSQNGDTIDNTVQTLYVGIDVAKDHLCGEGSIFSEILYCNLIDLNKEIL